MVFRENELVLPDLYRANILGYSPSAFGHLTPSIAGHYGVAVTVNIFKEFMTTDNEDNCLDVDDKMRKQLSDEDTSKLIKKLTKSDNVLILHQIDKNERNRTLRNLKEMGCTVRQLERITGLGRRIIEKA